MVTPELFTQFPFDEYFDCCQIFTSMKNADMNILVIILYWGHFSMFGVGM